MRITVILLNESNIYIVYNRIYNTLKSKGYNLAVEIPARISFIRNYKTKASFRWSDHTQRFHFMNKGVINIIEEEKIKIIADIKFEKGIIFYSILLTMISVAFYLRLDIEIVHIAIFWILVFGIVFSGYYFSAKSFINDLCRGE